MQTQLTLHATLAFVGGLAAGSLLAMGSSMAANSLILATPSPGEDCSTVLPKSISGLASMNDVTEKACILLEDIV